MRFPKLGRAIITKIDKNSLREIYRRIVCSFNLFTKFHATNSFRDLSLRLIYFSARVARCKSCGISPSFPYGFVQPRRNFANDNPNKDDLARTRPLDSP